MQSAPYCTSYMSFAGAVSSPTYPMRRGLPFLSCTEAIDPSRGRSQHSTEELFFLLTIRLGCAVKDPTDLSKGIVLCSRQQMSVTQSLATCWLTTSLGYIKASSMAPSSSSSPSSNHPSEDRFLVSTTFLHFFCHFIFASFGRS